LRARGWNVGENLVIEASFAANRAERLPALARRMLDNGAELLFAVGTPAALAAARTTTSVPIVFNWVTFPVEQGFVDSFARPGRNVTGVSDYTGPELAEKRIQMLREVAPNARRMGWIVGTVESETVAGGRSDFVARMRAAASTEGFESSLYEVRDPEDIETSLAAALEWRAQVLQVGSSYVTLKRQAIGEFCLRHRLPSATAALGGIETAGLLMRFGAAPAAYDELFVRSVGMVDRILRGANPAEIPVELPRTVEFVLNLKTAQALGLAIPDSLRLRADRLIE
jgi:putative ABC transport system substrate-binding protein